jgi:hypothetical protein
VDVDKRCGMIRGIHVGCAVTVGRAYRGFGGLEGSLLCVTVVGSMRTEWRKSMWVEILAWIPSSRLTCDAGFNMSVVGEARAAS